MVAINLSLKNMLTASSSCITSYRTQATKISSCAFLQHSFQQSSTPRLKTVGHNEEKMPKRFLFKLHVVPVASHFYAWRNCQNFEHTFTAEHISKLTAI